MITPLARSSPFQALNTERDWMDHMKNLSIHSQTYITWCMIRIYLGWAPVHRCLWCCCNSSQRWMSATISCHWRRLHLSNALSGTHCYCRGLVGEKRKYEYKWPRLVTRWMWLFRGNARTYIMFGGTLLAVFTIAIDSKTLQCSWWCSVYVGVRYM